MTGSNWLDDTQMEKLTQERKQENKVNWELNDGRKITAPIFRWGPRRGLTPSCEDGLSDKHVPELQQKVRKVISRAVSTLSLSLSFSLPSHDGLFLSI